MSETWFSTHQPTVPNRCDDNGTAWAVQAMVLAGLPIADRNVSAATARLIVDQGSNGAWIFQPQDGFLHIWCTSESLVALSLARKVVLSTSTLILPAPTSGPLATITQSPYSRANQRRFLSLEALNTLAWIAIGGYLLLPGIQSAAAFLLSYFKLDQTAIANNLVSAAIYGLITLLLIKVINVLKPPKGD